ncbi:hypothetical protein [Roseovarius sp. 2305UL8-3]|uniref:hypothetical protein n=1 Tax=Roseovarius conchicola TaxID=3121636 RepID=UPI003529B740
MTVLANSAVTQRCVCRTCEQMLRQQTPGRATAAKSRIIHVGADANDSYIAGPITQQIFGDDREPKLGDIIVLENARRCGRVIAALQSISPKQSSTFAFKKEKRLTKRFENGFK